MPRFVVDWDEHRRLVKKFPGQEARIEEEMREGSSLFNNSPMVAEQNDLKFFMQSLKEFIQYIDTEKKFQEALNVFDKRVQVENFGEIQPIFYDKMNMWWMWNGECTRWEVVDEVDVLNMVELLNQKNIISPKERSEIINALKQYGRKNIPKPIKRTWIQFNDKIVDIENGIEFDATPEFFVTNPIPYQLHKERFLNTPTMDRIFEEWVGKENVKKLYEIIAYSLLPDYPINRIFCFVGAGMNGKSKFLELLRKFIGFNNCCSTELDTLLNSRFEITRLHKKLICQMGETNFNEMNKTSVLKKLSGGDLIGFEYKNKNPFEEINYAKIIIATNNLPTTTDKTIGFYRRWMIIDFPNQFSEKKDILAEIPEEEYESLTLKSIGILKDLLIKREFTNEGSVEERMKKYEEKSNPMSKFISEFCDTSDIDGFITKNSFSVKLNAWLKDNNHRTMSDMVINKWMKTHNFDGGFHYIDWYQDDLTTKKKARVWFGLKFIEN